MSIQEVNLKHQPSTSAKDIRDRWEQNYKLERRTSRAGFPSGWILKYKDLWMGRSGAPNGQILPPKLHFATTSRCGRSATSISADFLVSLARKRSLLQLECSQPVHELLRTCLKTTLSNRFTSKMYTRAIGDDDDNDNDDQEPLYFSQGNPLWVPRRRN
jgi:hypothetical protein